VTQLPKDNNIDVSSLVSIFGHRTNSYKFLFFQAILQLIKQSLFKQFIFSFDELEKEMIKIADYPINVFKLSFGTQDHPPGLTIQPVDQPRPPSGTEIEPQSSDQARMFIAFGGMTHQARRFVDHQQVVIFVNDRKQIAHGHSPPARQLNVKRRPEANRTAPGWTALVRLGGGHFPDAQEQPS